MVLFGEKMAEKRLLTIPVELLQENRTFDLQSRKLDIALFVHLPYFSFQNPVIRWSRIVVLPNSSKRKLSGTAKL